VDALPVVEMYDAATALLVMHFLPDDGSKEEFLHGIAARLKSDAPMLLADMSGRPGSPEFELLFAAWKVHWREEHGLEPDDESLEKEFAERRIRLGWIDEKRHLELFKQAGFGKPVRFWSGLLFSGWYLRKR
jgi:tRNA (cmo5U34)-methyltransferase